MALKEEEETEKEMAKVEEELEVLMHTRSTSSLLCRGSGGPSTTRLPIWLAAAVAKGKKKKKRKQRRRRRPSS